MRRRPAPRPRRRRARAPAARRRSSSSTPTSCRAGSRRRAAACRRSSRSPPRPSRRRRRPAGGRSRSRGAWPGRTRSTGPSARRRGCAGRTRSTPRRWRTRRTGGRSTAGSCTSSGTARAGTARSPDTCRGNRARRCRRRCRAAGRDALRGVPRRRRRRRRRARPSRRRCRTARRRRRGGRSVKSGIIADRLRGWPAVRASGSSTAYTPSQHREGVAAGVAGARRARPPAPCPASSTCRAPAARRRGDDGRGALGVERVRTSTAPRRGCPASRKAADDLVDGLRWARRRRCRSRPACSRLRANPARAACAASGPSVARNARGRAPVAARTRVGAVAEVLVRGRRAGARAGRRPAARPGPRAGPGRCAGTGFSCRSGNSLTPVTGARRVAASPRPPGPDGRDPVGDEPGVERGDDAARRLELLEERPGRRGRARR